MISFFKRLVLNIGRCFSKKYLPYHLLAICLTWFLVWSGFDWIYFVYFQNSSIFYFFFPAVVIGGLVPLLSPIILFISGKIKKSRSILTTAYALAQAGIIGSIVSSFYKALTGRVGPEIGKTVMDISHTFQFGFLRGGIFWGWPSSHTTIAFATAVTLFILYSKKQSVRYLTIIYALYIGIGVSMSIHWFSDFVAGAIFGTIIGLVVGKSFTSDITYHEESPSPSKQS